MKDKLKLLLASIFVISIMVNISMVEVSAKPLSTYNKVIGCNITSKESKEFANNFKKELEKRDIPENKYIGGTVKKTLSINKTFATEHCTLVYGTPRQLASYNLPGNAVQNKDPWGYYQYLGFSVEGKLLGNIDYYASDEYSPATMRDRPFQKNPWSSNWVQNQVKSGLYPKTYNKTETKPNVVDGVALTRVQELDRTRDSFYLRYTTDTSRGHRGYFTSQNYYLKKNLRGVNLTDYASVPTYPTAYTLGVVDTFYRSQDMEQRHRNEHRYTGPNNYWYSNNAIPPHKVLFKERNDIELTSISVNRSDSTYYEHEKVVVTYNLKNNGQIKVSDPSIRVRLKKGNGSYSTIETVTYKGTIQPNGVAKGTVEIPSSKFNVTSDTNYTIELYVNPGHTNPNKETDRTNNSKTNKITVKNLTRALKVTIDSPKNNSVYWENANVTVKYTVKATTNYPSGRVNHTNPPALKNVTINQNGSSITRTLYPGGFGGVDAYSGSFSAKMIEIPGNKDITKDQEVFVSASHSNATNDSKMIVLKSRNIVINPYVHSFEILSDSYFKDYTDIPRVFEEDVVKARYKIGFESNISGEAFKPTIRYGFEGGELTTETLGFVLQPGEVSEWQTITMPEKAKIISGNDFKEEFEKAFIEITNVDLEDTNTEDNKISTEFKSVNKVYDIALRRLITQTPQVPISNGNVSYILMVCNLGNQDIDSYDIEFKYKGINGGKSSFGTIERGVYNNIDVTQNCQTTTVNTKMIDIENLSRVVEMEAYVIPSIPNEVEERSIMNNKMLRNITVQNPNAAVYVYNTNEGTISMETGNVSVVIQNNMFRDISSSCGTDCKSGTNRSTNIIITNETNGETIKKYSDYRFENLPHGERHIINISKDIIDYVNNLPEEQKKYQIIEIGIKANIPHYIGEVDFSGNVKYDDNSVETSVLYFPPRPNVSIMDCVIMDNPGNNYFTMNGGVGPIKTCAGHYPNNPSTAIEKGMQAYHYVQYRFFPAPMPKYEIHTPAAGDKNSPYYFNQIFDLNESITEKGDEEAFIFEGDNKRGRYLPTGAEFDFEIKEKRDGGQVIASGKVTYDIPESCYQTDKLDLWHSYGCGEIMLFVPNPDTNRKFETPEEYENETVVYPLGGEKGRAKTRIPYLNPGLYEFSFEANERFDYYYQVNNGKNYDYYWSNRRK